jgi:hypothetical protein
MSRYYCEIKEIYGLPIKEAVITQRRHRGGPAKHTWGLRPKMRVVFTMNKKPLQHSTKHKGGEGKDSANDQQESESPAVWFKGTVKVLMPKPQATLLEGTAAAAAQEYSYQERKYWHLDDTPYWREQFRLEQSKWQSPPLSSWEEFRKLRTYWPTKAKPTNSSNNNNIDEEENCYEFDLYPCSFWLKEGLTHSKMELKVTQMASTTTTSTTTTEEAEDAPGDSSQWSNVFRWNTREG